MIGPGEYKLDADLFFIVYPEIASENNEKQIQIYFSILLLWYKRSVNISNAIFIIPNIYSIL